MKPSQLIKSTEIDAAYDKLHAEYTACREAMEYYTEHHPTPCYCKMCAALNNQATEHRRK